MTSDEWKVVLDHCKARLLETDRKPRFHLRMKQLPKQTTKMKIQITQT